MTRILCFLLLFFPHHILHAQERSQQFLKNEIGEINRQIDQLVQKKARLEAEFYQNEKVPSLGSAPQNLGQLNIRAPDPLPSGLQEDVLEGARPFDLSVMTQKNVSQNAPLHDTALQNISPSPSKTASSHSREGVIESRPLDAPVQTSSLKSAKEDYQTAYNAILQGDQSQAASLFERFLADHQGDALEPNALFWLGEAQFAQAHYNDAALAYLGVYQDFSDHEKTPRALLKLGQALHKLGQKDEGCATFQKMLDDYPQAQNAVREQTIGQQNKYQCR